ncbi:hypothetical protein TNCV_1773111 [Trichonephila clavipes]|nr:hypothetical protein TNCV_1773111 [Trichonephila clavipes]
MIECWIASIESLRSTEVHYILYSNVGMEKMEVIGK